MKINHIIAFASSFLISTAIGSKISEFSVILADHSDVPLSAHVIQKHGKPHKLDLAFKKGDKAEIAFDWGKGWHGVSGIIKIADSTKASENYCEIQYFEKFRCPLLGTECHRAYDNKVLSCVGNMKARIDFPSTSHPKVIMEKYQSNLLSIR